MSRYGLRRRLFSLMLCLMISGGLMGISYNKEVLKKAKKGDAQAQFEIGKYYYQWDTQTDYKQAVKWYKKAAKQGHALAQTMLGLCYFYGNGVKEDYPEAAEWFRSAADQGEKNAQNLLGLMYYWGDGVKQSYVSAVKWLRSAADQGVSSAQYYLGKCYYDGTGTHCDYEQALAWWLIAAARGDEDAKKDKNKALQELNAIEEIRARAAAQTWLDGHKLEN